MFGYFRKVTNNVLPGRSKNAETNLDSDSDEDGGVIPASNLKKKSKKSWERQKSVNLHVKAEEIKTISNTLKAFEGKLCSYHLIDLFMNLELQ